VFCSHVKENWYELRVLNPIKMRKLLLWRKLPCSENVVLCFLAKYCIFALAVKYHFSPHDVLTSSVICVKPRFWNYFSDLLYFYVFVYSSVFCYVFMFYLFFYIFIMYLITVLMLPTVVINR